jgi:hypothetical protein
MSSPIDRVREHLRRGGWSIGETCFGTVWQVDMARGLRRIITHAPTQTSAWRLAMTFARRSGDRH